MCDARGRREGRKKDRGRKKLGLQHNSNKDLARPTGSLQGKVALNLDSRILISCPKAPALVLHVLCHWLGAAWDHGLSARVGSHWASVSHTPGTRSEQCVSLGVGAPGTRSHLNLPVCSHFSIQGHTLLPKKCSVFTKEIWQSCKFKWCFKLAN